MSHIDRYIPPVQVADDDLLSRATLMQWYRNARWAFHTIHGWRTQAFQAQASQQAISSNLFNGRTLTNGHYHPLWQGRIEKTARRNFLRVVMRSHIAAGQTIQARVLINGVVGWQGTLPVGAQITALAPITLTPLSIAPGATYVVVVEVNRTAGPRTPQFITVDCVEGFDANGLPAGFPTLPQFWDGTGATSAQDLDADALNALVTAMRYLFDRIQECRRVGLSGFLEMDRTHFDLADGWVVLRHGTFRHLADHDTIVIGGRLAPTDGQQLRLVVNGVVIWTQTVNGPDVIDPWEREDSAAAALAGVPSGTLVEWRLEFLRTSNPRPPAEVATRYSLRTLEARRTSLPVADPLQPAVASTSTDIRPVLQGIRDMLTRAYGAYQGKASSMNVDPATAYHWEGAAAWDRQIGQNNLPHSNKGLDPERQGDAPRLPLAFGGRWGDQLRVRGQGLTLSWGPFTPDPNEPRNLTFANNVQITQGADDITTVVWFDALSPELPEGQTYYLWGKRVLYGAEAMQLVEG